MAGIDKIYGNIEQYIKLRRWLIDNSYQCQADIGKDPLMHMYDISDMDPQVVREGKDFPMTNFPVVVDKWMYTNCDLDFVKAAIYEQYQGDPNDTED